MKKYVLVIGIIILFLSGCEAVRPNNTMNKGTNTMEICVNGFNMKYVPQDRNLTIDDFQNIELGESIDEIREKIGEPDGWVGSGILQPVYILEDRRAVLCHFSLLYSCEDLKELIVYNGSNIDCILKEK